MLFVAPVNDIMYNYFCVFLYQIILPQRPPWWELFDTSYEEIDDIALTIVKLYARPKVWLINLLI